MLSSYAKLARKRLKDLSNRLNRKGKRQEEKKQLLESDAESDDENMGEE